MSKTWPKVRLEEVLTERRETPDSNDLDSGRVKIVEKISFGTGQIQFRSNGSTKTGMILIRPGDLVVSGINAAKGAVIEFIPNLTSRLLFVKISADPLKDMELQHHLSVFENHVYGVVSQYNRIQENVKIKTEDGEIRPPLPGASVQVGLDVYYYTLTWDKLKKIFQKLCALMNDIRKTSVSIPVKFNEEYKTLKNRINHFFAEFDHGVRNEYEHPSLKPRKTGNIIDYGSLFMDSNGDIRKLVGEVKFSVVKKEHIERLINLWILLVDLFITSFTDKCSSMELLKFKQELEKNIDLWLDEYVQHRRNNRNKEANDLLYRMIMSDIYLSGEGLSLDDSAKNKIYSAIWKE